MDKPFYRGVFKDVIYISTKGFDDSIHQTAGNADSVNNSKAGRDDSNIYNG
jgi:hypothetical protein